MIVVSAEDPVRRTPLVVGFAAGATLAEYARQIPLRDERMRPFLSARIGRHYVPRGQWHRVVPHDPLRGETIVTFEIAVHGGGGKGGGGRKLFSAIAAIALIGITLFATAGGLAPLLGAGFKAGGLGAKLIGAIVSIAGSLLLQGLAPEPEEPKRERQLGFAGANNDFSPGSPLPRIIGTHKIAPPYVVPPFTTIKDEDQYVTAVYGLAGWHNIDQATIMNGEVPLVQGADVEYEIRSASPLIVDTPLTLVTDTIAELGVNLRMSEHQLSIDPADEEKGILKDQVVPENSLPRWHRVRTRKAPHRFVVNWLFDQGLVYRQSDGGTEPGWVMIKGRFRQVGEASWRGLPRMVVIAKTHAKAVRVRTEFQWVATVPNTSDSPWPITTGGNPDQSETGWVALDDEPSESVPSDWYTPLSGPDGTYYAGVRLLDEGRLVKFYLDQALYPRGTYEFEFQRSKAFAIESWTTSTSSPDDWFGYYSHSGEFKVDMNITRFNQTLGLTSVQSVWPEAPIDQSKEPVAFLLAVKVRNMQLDRVSFVATGMQNEYGIGGLDNPAVAYRHVLQSSKHTAFPLPASRFDEATLDEWETICNTEDYKVSLVVTGENQLDVLKTIARAGFASPKLGDKIGVAIDRPRPGPVGMINQNNATGFSLYKPLFERPHAILATFEDELDEYRTREIAVYDEGFSADGAGATEVATRFERVVFRGITREAKVVERAEHDLRWMRHRSSLLSCVQDIEYLEHSRGDRVWVETDILGQQGGRGRVLEVVATGDEGDGLEDQADVATIRDLTSVLGRRALVTEVVLDEEPDFGPAGIDLLEIADLSVQADIGAVGAPMGILVRLSTGALVTAQVASYEGGGRMVLSAPLSEPINPGDLVTTGPLVKIARDMIVLDVSPGPDRTANLTLTNYAASEMFA